MAAVYPENVHYEKDGKLKDIDNRLEEVKVEVGNKIYQNEYTYEIDKLKSIKHNGTNYEYIDTGTKNRTTEKVKSIQNGENRITYTYDENGNISGIRYRGQEYYYIKNIQNDIIGILNSNLEEIVRYEYDSWGQVLSVRDSQGKEITDKNHIGHINPYRYRSYRYDSKTKLYYLNSRYYNPEWGRFINADGTFKDEGAGIIVHNMYMYSANNYINLIDPTGNCVTMWAKGIQGPCPGPGRCQDLIPKSSSKITDGIILRIDNTTTKKKKINSILSNNGHGNVPIKGKPNSRVKKPNGDVGVYGPDGKALKDIDSSHPENHPELENPHEHDWNWDGNNPSRGKAHNFTDTAEAVATGMGVGVGGYAIYRVLRMLPSL